MNKPSNNSGFRRLVNACKYSAAGLKSTFMTEAAFRQETYLGVLALPLSFVVADSVVEWILLVVSFLLIMLTEIVNSAIEAVVDRCGHEHHELSAKAKDAGSAAVAVAIAIGIITWVALVVN